METAIIIGCIIVLALLFLKSAVGSYIINYYLTHEPQISKEGPEASQGSDARKRPGG